ncbi:11411_t:CDS:2, partial [Funneliformis mosseae]
ACGIISSRSDLIVAANAAQFGTVICRVVDSCPGCSFGDLDLSPAAFERIANLELGRAINWDFIN